MLIIVSFFRYERKVTVDEKDMSNNMVDYAVSCAHEALDEYGMYQSTGEILDNIALNITEKYAKRYKKGNWSCCVAKADIAYDTAFDKFLSFSIDGYSIIVMQDIS